MSYKAIILIGPPFSGKKTIGKLLENEISNSIYLDQEKFKTLYHNKIKSHNDKNLILSNNYQNIKTLQPILNILNKCNKYKIYLFDLFTENPKDMIITLLDRMKNNNDIKDYNESLLLESIESYESFYKNNCIHLDYLKDSNELVDKINRIISVESMDVLGVKEDEIKYYSIINSNEDVEMSKINNIICNDKINVDIRKYNNFEDVKNKLEDYFNESKFNLGTICKYYRKLCGYLQLNEYLEYHVYEQYMKYLQELESKYRLYQKQQKTDIQYINNEEMGRVLDVISANIDTCSHESIKIIGKYYLLIDYKQPLMYNLRLSDFIHTSINVDVKDKYYLDLETRKWINNENGEEFIISKEFIDYVKLQHGRKKVLNYRYLVGKQGTFDRYANTTGTTTFSKLFKDTFKIEYQKFIQMLKENLKYNVLKNDNDNTNNEHVLDNVDVNTNLNNDVVNNINNDVIVNNDPILDNEIINEPDLDNVTNYENVKNNLENNLENKINDVVILENNKKNKFKLNITNKENKKFKFKL